MDTAAVGRVLVKHLETGEQSVREAAARSLRHMPAAAPTLVKALLAAKDEDTATWLAGVLRAHAKAIKPADKKKLAKATAEWAAKGDPRGEAVAELMRTVDPESREDALLKKAKALAGRKKWEEAYQAIRPLSRDGRLSTRARFELGVLGVKAAGKRLANARRGRGLHDSLQPFEQLYDSDFPLVDQLFKSRYLSDEDRYHIGFRFLESIESDNKDLGEEVLTRVAEKSPRSKIGKAAKNKLKLAGLL